MSKRRLLIAIPCKGLEDKFWSFVNKTENGCWNWIGCKSVKGYGRFKFAGQFTQAHRMAYRLVNGEIPSGMCVCHSCDNRACCNPKHLWVGTNQDNIDDRERKGRNVKPVGQMAGLAKLTWDLVDEMRYLKFLGASYASIARAYGVAEATATRAVKGLNWRNEYRHLDRTLKTV